jgi:integrating conjugative element protein (TIGR03759 family)
LPRPSTLSVGLDIFLLDTGPGDDAAVRVWAGERGIPLERVRTRQITLNHDQGTAARLGIWQDAPALALQTTGGARATRLADLH